MKEWKPTSFADLVKAFAGLIAILVINALQHNSKVLQPPTPPQQIPQKVKKHYEDLGTQGMQPKKGVMVDTSGQRIQKPQDDFRGGWLYMVKNRFKTIVGLAAKASNLQYYYANGYFLDFVPFEVDNVYIAMNYVAQRLRYQYDKEQFGGRDIWQTSKEAYERMRGDCEDHAILLADWLSTLGFDARVAVGTHKGNGHAWVVWFKEGESYIIEATAKRKRFFFPYAKMMTDYKAKYMFNKDAFWVKEGYALNDDYVTGWRRTAYFQAIIN